MYESPSKMGSGPHFTIGGKPQQDFDNKLPGPGAYEPSDALTKDKLQNVYMSKS